MILFYVDLKVLLVISREEDMNILIFTLLYNRLLLNRNIKPLRYSKILFKPGSDLSPN
jgi:hypothetical protein